MPHNEQAYTPAIEDIVNVDALGRAHRPDGTMMAADERTQLEGAIDAHSEQIINGLDGHATVAEKLAADQAAEDKQAALNTLVDLQESGKTLDGPTLTKAGLGYQKRLELGYVGSIDKMLEDAKAVKVERDEAKAVAEVEKQREQERAENRAAGQAQADAWKAEANAGRKSRQETDAYIGKLMAGTDILDGMTYKERLENGGAIGLAAKVEQAKLSREDAISYAEAWERDTSHLKPRYVEVTRKPAAEQRAAEMAAFLKDMHPRAEAAQAVGTAQAKVEAAFKSAPVSTGVEAKPGTTDGAQPAAKATETRIIPPAPVKPAATRAPVKPKRRFNLFTNRPALKVAMNSERGSMSIDEIMGRVKLKADLQAPEPRQHNRSAPEHLTDVANQHDQNHEPTIDPMPRPSLVERVQKLRTNRKDRKAQRKQDKQLDKVYPSRHIDEFVHKTLENHERDNEA